MPKHKLPCIFYFILCLLYFCSQGGLLNFFYLCLSTTIFIYSNKFIVIFLFRSVCLCMQFSCDFLPNFLQLLGILKNSSNDKRRNNLDIHSFSSAERFIFTWIAKMLWGHSQSRKESLLFDLQKITEDNFQTIKDYSNWSRRIGVYKAFMITTLCRVIIKNIQIIIKIIKYLER